MSNLNDRIISKIGIMILWTLLLMKSIKRTLD